MRSLVLTLAAVLVLGAAPDGVAARPTDRCAALAGRDLAPGPGQRAVRRGAELRYCTHGGSVRRLGGAPSVRGADGELLLLHRRGRAEVLDVHTGRRASLGPARAIVHAAVADVAGVIAVRRTGTGDAVVVAAPGRAELVVEDGPGAVEAFGVTSRVTWTRAGVARRAELPLRRVRCTDLRGPDFLAGPERLVTAGNVAYPQHVGCAGAPDAPTFVVGDTPLGSQPHVEQAGTWLLRRRSWDDWRYGASDAWSTLDLATGRTAPVAYRSGAGRADERGERLLEHVLLGDGRLATITAGARTSAVVVHAPLGAVVLDRTADGAPEAGRLRVDGDVVRWTVAGEERSAPLP